MRPVCRNLVSALALSLAALLITGRSGFAADTVTVGKSIGQVWHFVVPEIGMRTGIFAKEGLDLDIVSFAGEAKLQQAMTGNSLDFGLVGGPAMAFSAKGVPAKAVAVIMDKGSTFSVTVPYDSKLAKPADLKGKKLGITTVGSLTEWVAERMIQGEGWGPDDVTLVSVGGAQGLAVALKMRQVDAIFLTIDVAYELEEKKEAKPIFTLGKYTRGADMALITAHDTLIAKQPGLVRRFVKAWFETTAYMKANKQPTVEISAAALNISQYVATELYDKEIGWLSPDGHFDPAVLKALKQTFLDMGTFTQVPSDETMLTTQFVPAGR